MAYYIERTPIDPARLSVTVAKLATAARIDREAAAFAPLPRQARTRRRDRQVVCAVELQLRIIKIPLAPSTMI